MIFTEDFSHVFLEVVSLKRVSNSLNYLRELNKGKEMRRELVTKDSPEKEDNLCSDRGTWAGCGK